MCVAGCGDFNTNKIDDYLVYKMYTKNYPDKLLAKSIASNRVVWLQKSAIFQTNFSFHRLHLFSLGECVQERDR